MAVLDEGGRRRCGVGSGKFYRKPHSGSHPCWLRGITTGTEGAEKGSLEPEHGVNAGSDGKSERSGKGEGDKERNRFPKIQMRPEIVSASTNNIKLLGWEGMVKYRQTRVFFQRQDLLDSNKFTGDVSSLAEVCPLFL